MREFGREFKNLERFLGKSRYLKYLPIHNRTDRIYGKKHEDTENYASKKMK